MNRREMSAIYSLSLRSIVRTASVTAGRFVGDAIQRADCRVVVVDLVGAEVPAVGRGPTQLLLAKRLLVNAPTGFP